MSSQSATPSKYGDLIRDASDVTRRLRQRLVYEESRLSVPTLGYPEPQSILKGNQYRLSFLYGKLGCTSCQGGGFNSSGVVLQSTS